MATKKCQAIYVLLFAQCLVNVELATRVELRLSDLISATSRQTSIAVREGGPFELVCEADVDDSAIGLKYRGVIFNSSKPGVSWTTETLTKPSGEEVLLGKLNIGNVTLQDSGVYQCLPDLDLLNEKTISVEVKVTKAKALQIRMETNQSHVIASSDTDIHLSIRCEGEHDADPVWYLNGSRLEEGLSAETKVMTTINVVASREDNIRQSWLTRQADQPSLVEGRYQCVDVNHYMTDSNEFVVSGTICQTVVSFYTTLFVVILATFWAIV